MKRVSRALAVVGQSTLAVEPFILVGLLLLSWWPNAVTPWSILLVPGFALLRWRYRGRWSVPTTVDAPVVALLVFLPLAVFPEFHRPWSQGPGGTANEGRDGTFVAFGPGKLIAPGNFEHHNVHQGTISLWVLPHGWDGAEPLSRYLVDDISSPIVYKYAGREIIAQVGRVGDLLRANVADGFAADTWHHIAVTWNATVPMSDSIFALLWVDGRVAATRAEPFAPLPWDRFALGNRFDGKRPAEATIRGFGVWERPLSADEIGAIYRAGPMRADALPLDPAIKFFYPGGGDEAGYTRDAEGSVSPESWPASLRRVEPIHDMDAAGRAYPDAQALATPKLFGLLLGLGCVYALANALSSPRQVMAWSVGVGLLAIGIAAVAPVLLTASALSTGDDANSAIGGAVGAVVRLAHGGVNPNEIAGAILPVAVLLAGVALHLRGVARYVTLLAAGSLCGAIVLSESRGAMIGLAAGLGALALWRFRWLGMMFAVVLAGSAFVTLAAVPQLRTDLAFEASRRAAISEVALVLLRENLLSGIGLGQFPLAFRDLAAVRGLDPPLYTPHAHNLVLQAVLDLGLLGGLAYIGLLVMAVISGARAGRFSSPVQWPAAGLACGLLAFIVFGIGDTIAPGARGSLLLWVLLGLAAAMARVSEEDERVPLDPQDSFSGPARS